MHGYSCSYYGKYMWVSDSVSLPFLLGYNGSLV